MNKLSESDIILPKKYEIVDVIIFILDYLKNNYKLSESILEKIENYKKERILMNDNEFINLQDMLSGGVEKGKSLGDIFPNLVKEWDYEKNGTLTPFNISYGSNKKVWWMCENKHKQCDTISHRTDNNSNRNCPYCSGKRICKDNCLAKIRPDLAKQWHPILNGDLTPKNVTCGSSKKIWWICFNGHEWLKSINDRNRGKGCPYCSNQKVCIDNCLATLNPELAKEWHPTLNGDLTPNDITCGSEKIVWWKCLINPLHEWQKSIYERRGNKCKCPHCKKENKKNI